MMKISNYIINFFENKNVTHAFFLTGGAAMYMNDSLGRSDKIQHIAFLHEQAAGIAAEAYARVTNTPCLLMVTSGPGATNAITPVTAAWIESTPMFVLSGQVKRADMINGQGVRQMGMQEVDVISLVKPITKYAALVDDHRMIKHHLEEAWHEATTDRPGPVWLDVPLDIQAMEIEPEELSDFYPKKHTVPKADDESIDKIINLLQNAERPCLMLGNGIRLSGAAGRVEKFVACLGIPVLTTWNGIDLIENDHPLYMGRPGGVGQRAATIIQQNCDLLLTVGARLNLLQTGFNFAAFARGAKHVMVDIDPAELGKVNVRPFLAVHSDAGVFMDKLVCVYGDKKSLPNEKWFYYCRDITRRYPFMMKEYVSGEYVNSFAFVNALSRAMASDDIYVSTSSGSAIDVAMQVFQVQKGQRVFSTKGLASMGFDLPACIGASLASGGKRVVCVTGDGGFQMNVQELETLARINLPVKIFVLDNNGYAMIRNSHMGAFNGKLTACTPESGLTLPDVTKQAAVYGIQSVSIEKEPSVDELMDIISKPGPLVGRVKVDIAQPLIPRQSSYRNSDGQMESLPLEEMTPPLLDDEMNDIMLIPRIKRN
jgi:acetolactate synthase-1/2/3 large subunit